jgi:hypothetical protein
VVDFIYPALPSGTSLSTVLAERGSRVRQPFDAATIDFLDAVSRSLFAVSRREPALAPLAFFLRRSNLRSLAERAGTLATRDAILVPQGMVFHVPPTNVDTLFLYTLAISMLTGNSNVVRISPNAGPATYEVLGHLLEALVEAPDVGAGLMIIRFGRDDAVLDLCSASADLRMVWGGDGAITAIRRSALAPGAKELTFPDRISLAAIDASAWAAADEPSRVGVVEGLYNDVYWFDQMACSSPAQLVLVGADTHIEEAARDISQRLNALAERRYQSVDGQAINKMVSLVTGLDRGLGRFNWVSNNLVTVDAADLASAVEFRPGGGFISVQGLPSLDSIIPQLTRRVQTLSVFGFDLAELRDFAVNANGRGIDRIVPIGHALDFDAVWDGKDLVAESLRLVTIN